jgi:hypothetical protein
VIDLGIRHATFGLKVITDKIRRVSEPPGHNSRHPVSRPDLSQGARI